MALSMLNKVLIKFVHFCALMFRWLEDPTMRAAFGVTEADMYWGCQWSWS